MNSGPIHPAQHSAALVVFATVLGCWIYLINGAGTGMNIWDMTTVKFPPPMNFEARSGPWDIGYVFSMVIMWWVMMVAMMVPGLMSHIATGHRSGLATTPTQISLLCYFLGYVLVWLPFSLAATLVQFMLEWNGLTHGFLMWSLDVRFSIFMLVAVGLYQLSPLKQLLLLRCHQDHPTTGHGREALANGIQGAWHSGWQSGWHCVANSWPLMLLLYVGGIMNLVWIIALAVINLIERKVFYPRIVANFIGGICFLFAFHLFVAI